MNKRSTDIIDDFAIECKKMLDDCGIDENQSAHKVDEMVDNLRVKWGGDRHYVYADNKEKRNNSIIDAHKSGDSRIKNAAKHHVHPATVDRVISKKKNQQNDDVGFGSKEWNL